METAVITELTQLLKALQDSPEKFTDGELGEIADIAQTVSTLARKRFVDRLIARTPTD